MATLDLTDFGGGDLVSGAQLSLNNSTYAPSIQTIAPGFSELVDESQAGGEPWYETAARLIPMVAATYQQKQLLDVQVNRAKQGLPPLNVSQYGLGVQVGLDSNTRLAIFGGVAVLGALLLTSMRGRR